jgi:hypothetical protein
MAPKQSGTRTSKRYHRPAAVTFMFYAERTGPLLCLGGSLPTVARRHQSKRGLERGLRSGLHQRFSLPEEAESDSLDTITAWSPTAHATSRSFVAINAEGVVSG